MTVHKSTQHLRIVVLGYIVRGPLGGLAWHHLQYVIGLSNLGHDVYYIEDSDDYPSCYDPRKHVTDINPEYGLKFTAMAFNRLGLNENWAFYNAHTDTWHGPCCGKVLDFCNSADLLLNVSGVNPLRPWFMKISRRVLIDTDPVFTQIAHLSDEASLARAKQHTTFLTFAENIESSNCSVPNDKLPWMPTRQPVVLKNWPVTSAPEQGAFTTVMQWDSYQDVEYNNVHYGMKSESFTPYLDMPAKTSSTLEIALGSKCAPREQLVENGWLLKDPLKITNDPWTYQSYIQKSKGEFSIAKQGYVVSNSGWFSERSAAYLASGRPVIIQDTGFSDWMKVGEGICSFSDPNEALSSIDEINSRYGFHCQMARVIADEYFDSMKVLTKLVTDSMGTQLS